MNAAKKKLVLYNQVVDVAIEYLGPAAERFITRQIKMHVGKRPEDLTKNDLKKLIDWIRLAIALLTEDTRLVNDFTNSLQSLTKNSMTTKSNKFADD